MKILKISANKKDEDINYLIKDKKHKKITIKTLDIIYEINFLFYKKLKKITVSPTGKFNFWSNGEVWYASYANKLTGEDIGCIDSKIFTNYCIANFKKIINNDEI